MNKAQIAFFLLIVASAFIAVKKGKLTTAGGLGGAIIGGLVYFGTGITGLVMLAAFFLLGTVATGWKAVDKRDALTKETGGRTLGQVLANGGVAGLLGAIGFLFPQHVYLISMLLAASLASATADTLSSELGTVYGRRFYNILTFRRDNRGLDGVISLEGLLIGSIGSTIIAAIFSLSFGWSSALLIIILSGTAGNLADSVLGAALERKGFIKNDAVNFLNTLFAALVAWLLFA